MGQMRPALETGADPHGAMSSDLRTDFGARSVMAVTGKM